MNDEMPWIFVSHSSEDILIVREVRNYLEKKGAGPILFHLRSLTDPEKFWPIIEAEIAARNFFLFCDSHQANKSDWVKREREAVNKLSMHKAIRVGRICVDGGWFDQNILDRFLLNNRVFVIGDDRGRAVIILKRFDYRSAGGVMFSQDGLLRLGDGSQMSDDMIGELQHYSNQGWILVILNDVLTASVNFWRELPRPSLRERVMFVLPQGVNFPNMAPEIPPELLVIESGSFEGAISEAARRMLVLVAD